MALPREPQTIDLFIANLRLNVPRGAGAVLNTALQDATDRKTDDEKQDDIDGRLGAPRNSIDPRARKTRYESFEEPEQVSDSAARDLIDLFGLVAPIEQRIDHRECERDQRQSERDEIDAPPPPDRVEHQREVMPALFLSFRRLNQRFEIG